MFLAGVMSITAEVWTYLARAVRRSGDGFVKQGSTRMTLPPAGEKIEFGKSSNFLRLWSLQTGEICNADIGLLLDRVPPRVRWHAAVAEVEKPRKEPAQARSKDDKYANVLYGVIGAIEAVTRTKDDFQRWLNSPSRRVWRQTASVRARDQLPAAAYTAAMLARSHPPRRYRRSICRTFPVQCARSGRR